MRVVIELCEFSKAHILSRELFWLLTVICSLTLLLVLPVSWTSCEPVSQQGDENRSRVDSTIGGRRRHATRCARKHYVTLEILSCLLSALATILKHLNCRFSDLMIWQEIIGKMKRLEKASNHLVSVIVNKLVAVRRRGLWVAGAWLDWLKPLCECMSGKVMFCAVYERITHTHVPRGWNWQGWNLVWVC